MNTTIVDLANSSGSDSTANELALAAAILAAGAFVIACAQVLLEYFSSSENRSKCTPAAIDVSSKQVKFGWSWKFFKLRVFYPVLDLDCKKILALQVHAAQHRIDSPQSPINKIRKSHDNWGWRSVEERQTVGAMTVADPFTIMVNGERDPVTAKDLNWRERARFLWYRIRHPHYYVSRPRASWAQLLLAYGITNTSKITYRHADADFIPSSLDAPVQRIKLFDLGILSLLLGFNHVSINVRERDFKASGPFGSVSTDEEPGVGKVLRFEGDTYAIHAQISKGFPAILDICARGLNGKFSFGPNLVSNGWMCPLHLLPRAMADDWTSEMFRTIQALAIFDEALGQKLGKGQLAAEPALFREIYELASKRLGNTEDVSQKPAEGKVHKQEGPSQGLQRTSTGLTSGHLEGLISPETSSHIILESACSDWYGGTGQHIPTILAAAAIAGVGTARVGFPSRVLLEPFLQWFRNIALGLHEDHTEKLEVSENLLKRLKTRDIGFLRAQDTFWLSQDYIGISSTGFFSWIFHDTKELYDSCHKEIQDEIILRGDDREYTGEVKALLFPEAFALLDNFDPREWHLRLENILLLSPLKFQPINMLWAQVLILDIAIHYLVRGGWHDGPTENYKLWSNETVAVVRAVVNSWSDIYNSESKPDSPTTSTTGLQEAGNHPDLSPSPEVPEGGSSTAFEAKLQVPSIPGADEAPVEPMGSASQVPPASQDVLPPSSSEASSNSTQNIKRSHWDLATCLAKQTDLHFSDDDAVRQKKIDQLAELLKLRAVFFLAFLLLNPDSSDVYLAEESEVEMPIV